MAEVSSGDASVNVQGVRVSPVKRVFVGLFGAFFAFAIPNGYVTFIGPRLAIALTLPSLALMGVLWLILPARDRKIRWFVLGAGVAPLGLIPFMPGVQLVGFLVVGCLDALFGLSVVTVVAAVQGARSPRLAATAGITRD